jgi:signal transduction histidine kinase
MHVRAVDPPSAPVTIKRLQHARALHDRVHRWVRVIVPAAWLLVAAGSLRDEPGPGLAGRGLAVTVALSIFAVGGVLGIVLLRRGPGLANIACVALALAAAGVLALVQPRGPGLLGVVLCAAVLSTHVSRRVFRVVVLVGIVLLFASSFARGRPSPTDGLLGIFAVAWVWTLDMLAQQLRLAVDSAEELLDAAEHARQAELHAAALAERQQLAREMHDVLAHSLSGLILQLEGARYLSANDPNDPRLPSALNLAHRLAKAGLQEARRALGMLRQETPPGPEQLQELCESFERSHGIRCTLIVGGDARALGLDADLTIYRVAQEALTNAAKHAKPDRVVITLDYDDQVIRLRVEDLIDATAARDTGTAANRDKPTSALAGSADDDSDAGHGLEGMQERAAILGGALVAGPTPRGFLVEMTIPR